MLQYTDDFSLSIKTVDADLQIYCYFVYWIGQTQYRFYHDAT